MFQVTRKPGLNDFLQGDASLAETVQSAGFSGVDIIASGSRSHGSPEFLASGKLGDIVGELWSRYDVVMVDSPPLGAGADAMILGTLTGHLAIIVRTGQTNVNFAQAMLAGLGRLPVRTLGVILNDFVPGRGQGYYAYSAKYIDDYGAVDEPDEPNEPEALLGKVEG
jgi:tyrosine-protein kinase Etk/Wzc